MHCIIFINAEGIEGAAYPLVAANPLTACSALQNAAAVAGSVVLIQRGECDFKVKAVNAQAAGAVAAIYFDNEIGAYFVADDGKKIIFFNPIY